MKHTSVLALAVALCFASMASAQSESYIDANGVLQPKEGAVWHGLGLNGRWVMPDKAKALHGSQCENGVCLLPKVVATVQKVVSVPVRLVASVAPVAMASEDCGCHGQCGRSGCTCAPVAVAAVSTPVQAFTVVPMRTPVRTILRAPFRARPLQRLFCCQ